MKKYMPNYYQKSIYTVDYSILLSKGIKCLLFDLDNTIANPKSKEILPKTKKLFISLKQKGFKVIIFSNGLNLRVNYFKKHLNVEGYGLCMKPFSKKFNKLINKHNLNPNEIAIIGDQIITDIQGGNKVGIMTILVKPLTKNERLITKIMRKKEKKILDKLDLLNEEL